MRSSPTTIRVPAATMQRIEALAQAMDRSRAWIIKQAVEQYLEHEEWMANAVREAVGEAERGEFATDAEAKAAFAKHGVRIESQGTSEQVLHEPRC